MWGRSCIGLKAAETRISVISTEGIQAPRSPSYSCRQFISITAAILDIQATKHGEMFDLLTLWLASQTSPVRRASVCNFSLTNVHMDTCVCIYLSVFCNDCVRIGQRDHLSSRPRSVTCGAIALFYLLTVQQGIWGMDGWYKGAMQS